MRSMVPPQIQNLNRTAPLAGPGFIPPRSRSPTPAGVIDENIYDDPAGDQGFVPEEGTLSKLRTEKELDVFLMQTLSAIATANEPALRVNNDMAFAARRQNIGKGNVKDGIDLDQYICVSIGY
ncbi:hypothetical protein EDB19DRAFT_1829681 [Suillus lakei]|nr:hypothetical protein EDB19DRAFT_1829681 [Suillus lakei]